MLTPSKHALFPPHTLTPIPRCRRPLSIRPLNPALHHPQQQHTHVRCRGRDFRTPNLYPIPRHFSHPPPPHLTPTLTRSTPLPPPPPSQLLESVLLNLRCNSQHQTRPSPRTPTQASPSSLRPWPPPSMPPRCPKATPPRPHPPQHLLSPALRLLRAPVTPPPPPPPLPPPPPPPLPPPRADNLWRASRRKSVAKTSGGSTTRLEVPTGRRPS